MNNDFEKRLEQARQARRGMLANFRANRVKEMPEPLPVSGMRVFVRDVTMMDLVLSGKLPEPLVEVIQSLEGGDTEQEVDLRKIARNGEEFGMMVDALVMLGCVEPPVAEQADIDHVGIDELAGDDKMAIFSYLHREVQTLKSFRDEGNSLEAAQPGGDVQHASEPDHAA